MILMDHIVKRHGHRERFDERKVYASCYAAFLSCHLSHEQSEKLCEKVAKEVTAWIKGKKEVNSSQIFQEVVRVMKKYHKDAAFMYETHRDVA